MRTEEECRRFLRLVRALDRGGARYPANYIFPDGCTNGDLQRERAGEQSVLLWVLGEKDDPPDLDDVERVEAIAELLNKGGLKNGE